MYLSFILDTTSMTITCPQDKVARLQNMCKQLYFSKVTTVHVLEKVLGTMESVRPSTPLAALQYGKGGGCLFFKRQLLSEIMGG